MRLTHSCMVTLMSDAITLWGEFVVRRITKRTGAAAFKHIKVNDVIKFVWDLNGSYASTAPKVKVFVNDKYVDEKSATNLKNILYNFELEGIDDVI